MNHELPVVQAGFRKGSGTRDQIVNISWITIEKAREFQKNIDFCLFNLYAEYIIRNAGLEEAQGGIKIGGEIPITSDMLHPKGDQSWVFIGRTDVEAEIPILWPPDVKS